MKCSFCNGNHNMCSYKKGVKTLECKVLINVTCKKCAKKGHTAKYCTATEMTIFLTEISSHISNFGYYTVPSDEIRHPFVHKMSMLFKCFCDNNEIWNSYKFLNHPNIYKLLRIGHEKTFNMPAQLRAVVPVYDADKNSDIPEVKSLYEYTFAFRKYYEEYRVKRLCVNIWPKWLPNEVVEIIDSYIHGI